MDLLLQVLQTMIFSAVIILHIWSATSFSKNNSGYRWRKYLWLLLAVRLIIPFNFTMPGYEAPVNITIRPETSSSFNHFAPGADMYGQMPEKPIVGDNLTPTVENVSASEEVLNASENAAAEGAVVDGIVDTNTSIDTETTVSEAAAKKTGFIQSAINLLYKAAASKTTGIVILSVWLSVVVIFGVLRVLQYIYARRKYLSCSEVCTDEGILTMVEDICNEYGVKKAPVVMNCSMHTSPILMGYFKTMLIVPELDYTDSELNYILRKNVFLIEVS